MAATTSPCFAADRSCPLSAGWRRTAGRLRTGFVLSISVVCSRPTHTSRFHLARHSPSFARRAPARGPTCRFGLERKRERARDDREGCAWRWEPARGALPRRRGSSATGVVRTIAVRTVPNGVIVRQAWGLRLDVETLHVVHLYFVALIQALCAHAGARFPMFERVTVVPHPVHGLSHLPADLADMVEASTDRTLELFVRPAWLTASSRSPMSVMRILKPWRTTATQCRRKPRAPP